jgi:hypothetical protein
MASMPTADCPTTMSQHFQYHMSPPASPVLVATQMEGGQNLREDQPGMPLATIQEVLERTQISSRPNASTGLQMLLHTLTLHAPLLACGTQGAQQFET